MLSINTERQPPYEGDCCSIYSKQASRCPESESKASGAAGKDRLTRLSDDDISVFDIDSYKDEYGLFYGAESGGMQKTEGKVYKIDYNTMEVTAIDDSNRYIYVKVQAVDSRRILLDRSDRAFHGEYQNGYIDILDLESGRYTRNNKNADIHFYDNVLTDVTYLSGWLNKITVTDRGLIYISTRGGDSKLYYSPFGDDTMTELTSAGGKILGIVTSVRTPFDGVERHAEQRFEPRRRHFQGVYSQRRSARRGAQERLPLVGKKAF